MMWRRFRFAAILSLVLLYAPVEMFHLTGIAPSKCIALEPLTDLNILSKVRVTRKRVSLLDLCDPNGIPDDWKNLMSATNIGDTPELGTENYVYPQMLRKYLDNFIASNGIEPSQVRMHIPDKITVELRSIKISPEQIESIFKEFILSNVHHNPKDLTIHKISYSGSTTVPAGEITHDVMPTPRERLLGNVTLTVNFYVDGQKERSLRVSGRVELNQNVVLATRPIKRDDVITSADVQVKRANSADIPDHAATDPEQVIGKRVLRAVGIQQPISVNDLDRPLTIKRGSNVSIVFMQAGMRLSAKGQTREDGGLGDTIHVINNSSRKVVMCQVMDSQTVQALP